MNTHTLLPAEVIASFGRHYLAQDEQHTLWQVFAKGKKHEIAVGDRIQITPSGDKQAWVVKIEPRKNLLYRSDNLRSKLFAANIDFVFLMIAISPPFCLELLSRTMVACAVAKIPLHLLFNKTELLAQHHTTAEHIQNELRALVGANTPIDWISLKHKPEAATQLLAPMIRNKTILVIGQSGMGKSTLINLLDPTALATTNNISEALNTGKHTTTTIKMHRCEQFQTKLIDSPGFQKFGLHHVTEKNLQEAFPEIMAIAQRCRFDDCQHASEPHCAVKETLTHGNQVTATRMNCFMNLREEIQKNAKKW